MRTALDFPTEQMDQHEMKFVAQVREFGWCSTSVPEEDERIGFLGFTYTTGFWLTAGLPEVILFSLDSEVAHDVLWDIFRDAKKGRQFTPGVRLSSVFANTDAFLIPIGKDAYPYFLGWSTWFYSGDNYPCVQLLWPDKEGRFPWQDGVEKSFRRLQPDISTEGWIKALIQ
jgi:hypothetical protein